MVSDSLRSLLFAPSAFSEDSYSPSINPETVRLVVEHFPHGHIATEAWPLPSDHREHVAGLAHRLLESYFLDTAHFVTPTMRSDLAIMYCVGLAHDLMECCGIRYELAVRLLTVQGANTLRVATRDLRWSYTRRYGDYQSGLKEAEVPGRILVLADAAMHLAALQTMKSDIEIYGIERVPTNRDDILERLNEWGLTLDALGSWNNSLNTRRERQGILASHFSLTEFFSNEAYFKRLRSNAAIAARIRSNQAMKRRLKRKGK